MVALSGLRGLLDAPTSKRLLVAHTQSALGNGAGYLALMLLAYGQTGSPWLVAAVLIADFLPAMVLGPWLGAIADRTSRRACCIVADLVRAVAFAGLALVSGPVGLVAFALLAGLGGALFSPAVLAGLSGVYDRRQLPRAMALFGAVDEGGMLVGPLAAAGVLAVASPATVMGLNAASFVVSAVLIAGVGLSAGTARAETLAAATWAGVRQLVGMVPVARLLSVSTLAVLSVGMVNVAEVVFVLEDLDAGETGLSVVVAAMGTGVTVGALGGMRAGDQEAWLRRYLGGLALMAATLLAVGLAPSVWLAGLAFFACGLGNGLALTHERLLLVAVVPARLHGRVFALKRSLVAAAFSASFIASGALVASIGAAPTLAVAGAGAAAAGCLGVALLPRPFARPAPGGGAR